jgi:hypothetical protein
MKTILFLSLVGLALAGCGPARPENAGWIQDRWQVEIAAGEMAVNRQMVVPEPQASWLHGSPELAAETLEQRLLAGGAGDAECMSSSLMGSIRIHCRYHAPLAPAGATQPVVLPGADLYPALFDLPVNLASGLQFQMSGSFQAAGVITALPQPVYWPDDSGSFYITRVGLTSLTRMVLAAEYRMSPGDLQAPPEIGTAYQPTYWPANTAWLGWAVGLCLGLGAMFLIVPVRRRAFLPPKDRGLHWPVERFPRLARPLLLWLQRLVQWIARNWPAWVNGLLGAWLTLTGAQLLLAAFPLARGFEWFESWRALAYQAMAQFPPLTLLSFLLDDRLVFAVAALGALLVALGVGLVARWNAARLALLSALFGLLGGWVVLWPFLLLAPEYFSFQVELFLIGGTALLGVLSVALITLRSSRYRLIFAKDL